MEAIQIGPKMRTIPVVLDGMRVTVPEDSDFLTDENPLVITTEQDENGVLVSVNIAFEKPFRHPADPVNGGIIDTGNVLFGSGF